MESLLRRVRCISVESAQNDLKARGYPDAKPFAIVPGGLTGDSITSTLVVADGLVWEFAKHHDGFTRVYMHKPKDLEENAQYNSYA